MVAKYEQSALSGKAQVKVQRYKGLQNLPHWHMDWELICSLSGSAEMMAENAVFTLPENGCALIRSETVHYIKADPQSIIAVMKIDPDLMALTIGRQTVASPLLENEYPAAEVLTGIEKEISQKEKYHEIICASQAAILIAEIFRKEKTVSLDKETESSAYKELLKLISKNCSSITFEQAAGFMCFSKPYFSKYFRKMSGMTFSEYLNFVRVNKAAELIMNKKMSIGEAAMAAGFGTIRSFNRTFKRLTGFAPRSMPKDFIFIENYSSSTEYSFDPTLPVSELL